MHDSWLSYWEFFKSVKKSVVSYCHGHELNETIYLSIRELLEKTDTIKSVCNPYSA
jgi:hypothetical protein